ncbi:class I SAM-dependent methyltransferase [Heliorestis acidaminivorans]|uniref:Class I SAM-dependent methyltransferase n=1 Tax=Heliorestis acidaminivorans TaxID=553427 RepID=A0A6I0F4W5_9FIRM|nr:class I SAM-dependent methyltransferase [Heliorestis acidaminivorans]KAB2952317.1 class I SAM-dependent methyltransferase [Heliorestis acidaminivorans]
MYRSFAAYYDRLMADVDYDSWINFAEQAFALAPKRPQQILDLACGTGAITKRLLDRGYDVVGVDLSPEMLALSADCNQSYLEASRLLLLAQDMRRLELPFTVDAVVSFLDSLNYLESYKELAQVFERISRVLAEGGIFVADLHTEHKLSTMVGNDVFYEVSDDMAYLWLNHYDAEQRAVEMELTFFVARENGLYERFEEFHRQQCFSQEEIEKALTEAGLDIIGIYGDLKGGSLEENSERYFVVAQKK